MRNSAMPKPYDDPDGEPHREPMLEPVPTHEPDDGPPPIAPVVSNGHNRDPQPPKAPATATPATAAPVLVAPSPIPSPRFARRNRVLHVCEAVLECDVCGAKHGEACMAHGGTNHNPHSWRVKELNRLTKDANFSLVRTPTAPIPSREPKSILEKLDELLTRTEPLRGEGRTHGFGDVFIQTVTRHGAELNPWAERKTDVELDADLTSPVPVNRTASGSFPGVGSGSGPVPVTDRAVVEVCVVVSTVTAPHAFRVVDTISADDVSPRWLHAQLDRYEALSTSDRVEYALAHGTPLPPGAPPPDAPRVFDRLDP